MRMKMWLAAAARVLCLTLVLASCGRKIGPTTPANQASGSGDDVYAAAAAGEQPASSTLVPIRAAYFYNYMPASHLDSLKAAGFNRAMIKWIDDSLGVATATQLRAFVRHGAELAVEIAPAWTLQSSARLLSLGSKRRYTWGSGNTVESGVACPLDSAFWRSALVARAGEFLAAEPRVKRLVLDLELYSGSRHHYDAGPCRCARCVAEFRRSAQYALGSSGLERFEEDRLVVMLTEMLATLGLERPGLELGVFDLDFSSFVHRAMARALTRARLATVDYTERTYSTAGDGVAPARQALQTLGVSAPVVGGLWLKRFPPEKFPAAARSLCDQAGGYFVFTSYSLWQAPDKLTGPYLLPAPSSAYWPALRAANQ